MATARQVAANRRNASLPRGPLSAEARVAIQENAVKHGLTANHVVLKHENYADYSDLRASIVMEYLPHTPQEHRMADQIAQSYWRLLRCRRIETATFENRLGTLKNRFDIDPNQEFNDDAGISVCMANDSRDFDILRRYETSIERAWYRAIRELRAAQRDRRKFEAAQYEEDSYNPPLEDTIAKRGPSSPLANEVTTPENRTNKPHAPLSENGIGCVSYNYEEDSYNPPLEDTIAKRGPSSPLANEVTTPENRTNKPHAPLSENGIGCVSYNPESPAIPAAPTEVNR